MKKIMNKPGILVFVIIGLCITLLSSVTTFAVTFSGADNTITATASSGFCICPKCGYRQAHQIKVPCRTVKCPNCGSLMKKDWSQSSNEFCLCPKCDYKQPHQRGIPCSDIKCPKCGSTMVRRDLPENNKAKTTEISSNNTGDNVDTWMGQGKGPNGFCICPKCGNKQAHQRGVPCQTIHCSQCGSTMLRE